MRQAIESFGAASRILKNPGYGPRRQKGVFESMLDHSQFDLIDLACKYSRYPQPNKVE